MAAWAAGTGCPALEDPGRTHLRHHADRLPDL